ncbi:hypothetical protein TSOC_010018 [Tetrabaena socialis]|uniref:Uncharacterized protein n=1 Tax=Tetrabaena socialis TaxID=47790 RepID=A0A2J7ZUE1_9CHLO|nr:hypothetical protein TSOC_010018 [Tetrabaena socialis]|eukprot:PNH03882.1 hypothetical protein TSOC_010018 [Tetrabaena socialis]
MLEELQLERSGRPLHIYMNGDSTIRQQKNFLCSLLQPGFMHGYWPLDNTALTDQKESTCYNEALRVRITFIDNSCCDPERLAYLARNDTSSLPAWRPAAPCSTQQGPGTQATAPAAASTAAPLATGEGLACGHGAGPGPQLGAGLGDAANDTTLVVYLNCGLHLLQMGSARLFECLPQQYHYEAAISNMSRAAGELYPGSLQVFMTTNKICESQFRALYGDTIRRLTSQPEQALAECVRLSNTDLIAGPLKGNLEALRAACRDGLFVGASTRLLRKRMLAALAVERQQGRNDPEVVDGYAITASQCWASQLHDGRHFPFLVPLQALRAACRDGLFVGASTRLLRKRMLAALAVERQQGRNDPEVVDGYAITASQCWASQLHDGRHFPFLVSMVTD